MMCSETASGPESWLLVSWSCISEIQILLVFLDLSLQVDMCNVVDVEKKASLILLGFLISTSPTTNYFSVGFLFNRMIQNVVVGASSNPKHQEIFKY